MLRTADELRRRGGPLGESESLRETIEQLRTGRYTAQGEGTARLIDRVTKHADLLRDSLSQLPEKTRETRRWGESLASSTHEWLPSPPKLPSLPRLSLPKVSLPKIPATSMPTLPNLSLSGSAPAGWKMVLGVTLVVGILFLMSYLLIFGPRLHGARRGVWKGKLEAATIHDASTLQKAFENLALHLLGGHARSQHHRSIAAQLAASDPELKNAALDLSSMYERARYTPPPQQLTEQELLQANELYTHLAKKRPI
jgi:hypothetical protein